MKTTMTKMFISQKKYQYFTNYIFNLSLTISFINLQEHKRSKHVDKKRDKHMHINVLHA